MPFVRYGPLYANDSEIQAICLTYMSFEMLDKMGVKRLQMISYAEHCIFVVPLQERQKCAWIESVTKKH